MDAQPTLLVAVDPAAHAAAVVDRAVALGRALGGRLLLLHVVPTKPAVDPDVLRHPAAHPAAVAAMREEEERRLPALLQLARPALEAGLASTLRIAHGDVAATILETARDEAVDMIVLGTHGRQGVARFVLGSVAEAVVRESPAPVLTVRVGDPPAPRGVLYRDVPLDSDRST